VSALLELQSVSKRFGGVTAVRDVSFRMERGETLGIIGPNGAGKTTLLNLVSGALPVSGGRILFCGEDITGLPPDQICRRGIGRTHQIPQPFGNMTVRANVMVGCLYGRTKRISIEEAERRADRILQVVGLAAHAARRAGDLTLLERKRLELARALSLEPRLILLDEIAAGLTPQELPALKALICELRSSGLSMIIIEHVFEFLCDLCGRVLVLDWGETIAEGPPADVVRNPRVIQSYLGSRGKSARDTPAPAGGGEDRPARELHAEPAGGAPLLRVESIDVFHGALQALFGVSLEIRPGEIVALIGANGSGKTSTVLSIAGVLRPARGEIHFDGRRIDGLPPDRIVELGVAQCMEGRHIFPEFTVQENLEIGAYARRARPRARDNLDLAYDLFPVLYERRRRPGRTLSGGEQQMLAIARALMADPRLLILDEVSLGLAPVVIDRLYEAIGRINRRGVAVLLVEQNVHRSLAIAHRGYILERGRVSLAGSAAELAASAYLTERYFGL